MRVLQAYKSKRYLLRILFSVTALMVVVLFFTSLALQLNAERNAIRMQREANRKVMNQIQFNISYMTGVLNNLAVSLYMDPNIVPLLTLKSSEEMTVIRSMNSLKQAYLSSSFLHSILVYNGYDDLMYTVGELSNGKPDQAMAGEIVQLLRKKDKLPRMQLIPMNFSERGQSVDFFSIVIYQNFYTKNTSNESALVVNIKPEWLFENLQTVNNFDMPDKSSIFIMDKDGNVVLSGDRQVLHDISQIRNTLRENQIANSVTFGSFSNKLDGDDEELISYLTMKDTEWTLISVQPYDAAIGRIQEMRSTSVFVIASTLLLATILSVIIAHKLYKPVDRLISHIGIKTSDDPNVSGKAKDELSAVANLYSAMVQKLLWASNREDKQKQIVKNYYLRTLVSNSPLLNKKEFAENIEQNDLRIDINGPYRLVLIKVDGYLEFLRGKSHEERTLYYFAIGNISEEIIRDSRYCCEIADMRNDHVVMLLSPVRGSKEDLDDLLPLLKKIQGTVNDYYKLSLTMTISEPCDSYDTITDRYGAAVQYSVYKLLFGHNAIITPDMIRTNVHDLEYNFPEESEKKLVEAIRTNNPSGMEHTIMDILDQISVYHYDHIVHGILHVVDIIKTTIRDINKNRVVSLHLDLSSLSRQVLEKETMEEIGDLFRSVCRNIHEKLNSLDNEKNTALMDAIKEIVEVNYKDCNLSLQAIASILHMTPAYVGRMFKMSEYISVGEYLNEVRLRHAQAYLETKNFSIKEIMELVGFMNESTFFKLFKKSFGVTPKEYRLKKKLV